MHFQLEQYKIYKCQRDLPLDRGRLLPLLLLLLLRWREGGLSGGGLHCQGVSWIENTSAFTSAFVVATTGKELVSFAVVGRLVETGVKFGHFTAPSRCRRRLLLPLLPLLTGSVKVYMRERRIDRP